MRLAVSLCLWLALTAGLVLGLHGWAQLRIEARDLQASAERELRLVSASLASSAESAIRDDQELDVATTLGWLELVDPAMDVFVFDTDLSLVARSLGSDESLISARHLTGEAPLAKQSTITPLGDTRLAAVVPLRVRGRRAGTLVIIRPLAAIQADIDAERRAAMLSVAGLVITLSVVIGLVIHFRLHRPMRFLVAGLRRVAAGDLEARIAPAGHDELAELGREFDAMTAALQATRERLAAETEKREQVEYDMQRVNRLAVVGELAASLAHEIGSPLQVLNGRARALERRDDLPADGRRSARILVEQTDRISRIIDRLLNVARRSPADICDVDLRNPVSAVLELLAPQARRLGVRLEYDMDEIPVIRGDEAQAQQVTLNLAQNALRAAGPGGLVQVSVRCSSFEPANGTRNEPSVAIAVTDSGPGIAEDQRSAVFEPFFTGWQHPGSRPGVGLGLSVVRSIMIEHGGAIEVSTPGDGRGAAFTAHFPVPPRAARSHRREGKHA